MLGASEASGVSPGTVRFFGGVYPE